MPWGDFGPNEGLSTACHNCSHGHPRLGAGGLRPVREVPRGAELGDPESPALLRLCPQGGCSRGLACRSQGPGPQPSADPGTPCAAALRASFPQRVLDSLLKILECQLPAAAKGGGGGQNPKNMRMFGGPEGSRIGKEFS